MKDEFRPFHGLLPGRSLYAVGMLCLFILIGGLAFFAFGGRL